MEPEEGKKCSRQLSVRQLLPARAMIQAPACMAMRKAEISRNMVGFSFSWVGGHGLGSEPRWESMVGAVQAKAKHRAANN